MTMQPAGDLGFDLSFAEGEDGCFVMRIGALNSEDEPIPLQYRELPDRRLEVHFGAYEDVEGRRRVADLIARLALKAKAWG